MTDPIKSPLRELWASRIELMAGNAAIGLGNFLRFPVQAANRGGGAFMIPYFIALLLLGIPLMWSVTSKYFSILDRVSMLTFLQNFQGITASTHFSGITGEVFVIPYAALIFFFITIGINVWVLSHGAAKGIERFAKIAMPTLFIFAVILVIRVVTLGTPAPARPENRVINGIGYLWNPDFSQITKAKPWLAAAGQVFLL